LAGASQRFGQSARELAGRVLAVALAGLPSGLWSWLGPRLARPRPLAWYPGWRWAASEARGTRHHQLRAALWNASRKLSRRIDFAVEWYDGLRVRVTLGNDMSECLFVAGSYEPNEFMLLSLVLREGMTLIDVGANEGLYTLFASRRVGPGGRVIALEPSTRELERLQANLEQNGLSNVTVVRAGAHREPGRALLQVSGFGHEGHNTLGALAHDAVAMGSEEVVLETLDRIAEREGLARVDLLKIDAEGAEAAVLDGAREILATSRPLVLIEILEAALSAQGAGRADLIGRLRAAGYGFWVFGKDGRPEPAGELTVDGCNVIAVHPARQDLLDSVRVAAGLSEAAGPGC